MSFMLGPIHHWLFTKIKFQDGLVEAILNAYDNGNLRKKVDDACGTLEQGELADIIDESNIHGWLQERISVVERRLALTVNELLADETATLEEICHTVFLYGKANCLKPDYCVSDAYTSIHNLLLNGMPCDFVNQIIVQEPNVYSWQQMSDIHAKYWEEIGSDVQYFNVIRSYLIQGILDGTGIDYEEPMENVFMISR